MNTVESCFLNSLRCAMAGVPMTEDPDLSGDEWESLFRLAGMHHVLPLVFEAVRTLPSLKGSALSASVKQQVRQQVLLQTRKTIGFLSLVQELSAAGIRPLVVKGIVCRSLYPMPDHRTSSDEDLLISPGDLDTCREVFARLGLTTTFSAEQQARDYEIPYRQADGVLYIELHKSLFPPESESYGYLNDFFRDAHNQAVSHDISGISVLSLSHTDHLFYLICHALKHFLHSGFGIRQVCDIVMYVRTYGHLVDWNALMENCRKIHALEFTTAILRIGYRHLGLVPELCPAELIQPDIDEMPMLEDLLQAGVFGSSSDSRLHSSRITLEAMASQRQQRTPRNSVVLSLFPSAKKLQGRYPYLQDRPWLLPAAWVSRMGSYCRESLLQKPSSAGESLKLGYQRVDLLKYYGLLEENT